VSIPHATSAALGGAGAPCASCGAPLVGRFCAQCGAAPLDTRPLTVRRFAGDLWNEVTNVDSVTLRTVKVLFRWPGRLTREYLAGRTRWYLPPLRVYLLAFALMIFVRTVTGADRRIAGEMHAKLVEQDRTNPNLASIRARRARTNREMPDLVTPLSEAMPVAFSNPWLHLVDPLTVAVVLAVLYRTRRRNYAEHVLFALHLLAANCVLSIVTTALHMELSSSLSATDAISVVHWLAFATYAYFALRAVHGETRLRTGLKSIVLTAGAQAAMMVVPMGTALAVTMWTIEHLH
jgi:hypothetical protein